jgi:hypothetical protein
VTRSAGWRGRMGAINPGFSDESRPEDSLASHSGEGGVARSHSARPKRIQPDRGSLRRAAAKYSYVILRNLGNSVPACHRSGCGCRSVGGSVASRRHPRKRPPRLTLHPSTEGRHSSLLVSEPLEGRRFLPLHGRLNTPRVLVHIPNRAIHSVSRFPSSLVILPLGRVVESSSRSEWIAFFLSFSKIGRTTEI